MKNRLWGFIAGSVLSVPAFADASIYQTLYQDSIMNNVGVNGDPVKAQQYSDCHVAAMGAFPIAMQDVLFKTASETHDYQQARDAFNQLIVIEMAAGGERERAILSIIEASTSLSESCALDAA